jgi:hypothetical protein
MKNTVFIEYRFHKKIFCKKQKKEDLDFKTLTIYWIEMVDGIIFIDKLCS